MHYALVHRSESMLIRNLGTAVYWLVTATGIAAQTPTQTRAFHDRAVSIIREMSNRPLTPGDTFLTWAPEPGRLIHTVAVDARGTRSSLLRGDGMIGTAIVQWSRGHPSTFDVQWTTRDSSTGKAKPDVVSRGVFVRDSLRITGSKPDVVAIPSGLWAVADYGMEEALIPVIRSLAATGHSQIVSVFRPWHGRWDTVSVAVHDTAGLRVVELQGIDKLHELEVLTTGDALLWIVRFDQPEERRPLEDTRRYSEYLERLPLLAAIAKR